MSTATNKQDEKLKHIQAMTDDVKISMNRNINLSLSNGVQMQKLDNLAYELAEDSDRFAVKARKLRRKFCCQSWKMTGLVLLGIVIILIIIIVPIATK